MRPFRFARVGNEVHGHFMGGSRRAGGTILRRHPMNPLEFQPKAVVLWDLSPTDHAAWREAGCGTGSFADYQANLVRAMCDARAHCVGFVLLTARVAEVMGELRSLGLRNTSTGRRLALTSIYRRRVAGDSPEAADVDAPSPSVWLERQAAPLRYLLDPKTRAPLSDSA